MMANFIMPVDGVCFLYVRHRCVRYMIRYINVCKDLINGELVVGYSVGGCASCSLDGCACTSLEWSGCDVVP